MQGEGKQRISKRESLPDLEAREAPPCQTLVAPRPPAAAAAAASPAPHRPHSLPHLLALASRRSASGRSCRSRGLRLSGPAGRQLRLGLGGAGSSPSPPHFPLTFGPQPCRARRCFFSSPISAKITGAASAQRRLTGWACGAAHRAGTPDGPSHRWRPSLAYEGPLAYTQTPLNFPHPTPTFSICAHLPEMEPIFCYFPC